MDENWVAIYSTTKQYEIELISGMLEEHEIENIVVNKQDSAYFIGDLELFVRRSDILKAKTLIQELNH